MYRGPSVVSENCLASKRAVLEDRFAKVGNYKTCRVLWRTLSPVCRSIEWGSSVLKQSKRDFRGESEPRSTLYHSLVGAATEVEIKGE